MLLIHWLEKEMLWLTSMVAISSEGHCCYALAIWEIIGTVYFVKAVFKVACMRKWSRRGALASIPSRNLAHRLIATDLGDTWHVAEGVWRLWSRVCPLALRLWSLFLCMIDLLGICRSELWSALRIFGHSREYIGTAVDPSVCLSLNKE